MPADRSLHMHAHCRIHCCLGRSSAWPVFGCLPPVALFWAAPCRHRHATQAVLLMQLRRCLRSRAVCAAKQPIHIFQPCGFRWAVWMISTGAISLVARLDDLCLQNGCSVWLLPCSRPIAFHMQSMAGEGVLQWIDDTELQSWAAAAAVRAAIAAVAAGDAGLAAFQQGGSSALKPQPFQASCCTPCTLCKCCLDRQHPMYCSPAQSWASCLLTTRSELMLSCAGGLPWVWLVRCVAGIIDIAFCRAGSLRRLKQATLCQRAPCSMMSSKRRLSCLSKVRAAPG